MGSSYESFYSTTYDNGRYAHIDDVGDIYVEHYGSNSTIRITNTFDIENLIIHGDNNTIYLDDVEYIYNFDARGNNLDIDISRIREDNISQADANIELWTSGSDVNLVDGFNLELWFHDNGVNGNNNISIVDFWNIDVDLWGNYNSLYAYDVDDVWLDAYGGGQTITIIDAFDIERLYISGGDNYVYLNDVEFVTVDIRGGDNTLNLYNVAENGISFANSDVDIYGGSNTLNVDDIFDLDLDIRGGFNTISVNNATDIDINTHGYGENNITLTDVDDVALHLVGRNTTRIHSTAEFSADITVHGGTGTNHITTAGGFEATVNTYGNTDDTVIAGAGGSYIYTHGGNDYIDSTGAFKINVYAGAGDDTIIARGADAYIDAGSGHNTITASGVGVGVVAGSGNDTLTVDAAIGYASLGDGHNTVNFNVGVGSVTVGSGDDTINVNAAGAAINAGEGNNTIRFNGFAGDISVGSGNDTVHVNAAGVRLNAGEGDNSIHFNGFAGDITVGGGNDRIYVNAVGVGIDAGEGNNHFDVRALGANLTAGSGNDSAYVGAAVGVLDLGEGNNTIELHAIGGSIRVGSGDDTILARVVGASIDAGHGNNLFDVQAAGASLTAGDGDDTAFVGAAVGLLNLGGGNNVVELNAVGGNITVGDGDDTFVVNALGADLNAGNGDNIITAKGFGFSAETGSGNDRIWSLGVGGQEIDSGDGNDIVTAYGGVNVVHAGHGHNQVEVAGGLNVVQAGYGNNVIDAYGGANVVLSGHGNNDVDAFGGANAVFLGDGDNEVVAGGGLNIIAVGDGENNIFAAGGLNIILAGNGDSSLNTRAQAVTNSDRGANLVENGSFELGTDIGTGISFRVPDGWTQSFGQLEIHDTSIFNDQVSPYGFSASGSGRHILELDGTRNSGVYQDIDTRDGATYEITLSYRGTTTVSVESNTIEVWWDGEKVGEIAATHTDWRDYSFAVTGGDTSRLELRAAGNSDLLGGAVDNVRVNEILGTRDIGDGVLDADFNATAAENVQDLSENIVQNGSFELGTQADTGISFYVPTGWTQSFGRLEVHNTSLFNDSINQFGHSASGHGDHILELDGTENSGIYQDLNTRAGLEYDITISYRGTTTVSAESNSIEVWWAGQLVGTVADTHTDWRDYTFRVTGADTSRLEFRAAGTSDLLGGAIDNVRVVANSQATDGNLLTNGSFEQGNYGDANFGLGLPDGWLSSFGTPEFLKLANAGYGNAADGDYVIELAGGAVDGGFGSGIYQDVDTNSGSTYQVSLNFRGRDGANGADNAIEVWWDGAQVGVISEAHSDWRTYTFDVNGAAGDTSRLELRANDSTHLGGLIDDVRVVETGELNANLTAGLNNPGAGDNLITNGSFEFGNYGDANFGLSLPYGWSSSFGTPEFLKTSTIGLGAAADGEFALELAGGAVNGGFGSGVYQDVDTNSGETYQISLNFRGRDGANGADNAIEVWWDGVQVGVISEAHTDWRTYTFEVSGAAGDSSRLELRTTDSTHLGGLIDDVRVERVVDGAQPAADEPGNDIQAYGVGNLVISGSGSDRIVAGSLLNLAALVAVDAAAASDDSGLVGSLFGTSDGTAFGEDQAGSILINALASVTNLANVVIAGNGNNQIKTYGGHNLVQAGEGDDDITAIGNANLVVAGNGNNDAQLVGSLNAYWGGSGDDEIDLIGGNNILLLGTGDNTVTGLALGQNLIVGGGNAGDTDDIVITGSSNFLFLGSGTNNVLTIGQSNIVLGGDGEDTIFALGNFNFVNAASGTNSIAVAGVTNYVLGGDDNDQALILGGNNVSLLGNGNNDVITLGYSNVVFTGSHSDTVYAGGRYNAISTAAGEDTIIAAGQANVVLSGADDDFVTIAGQRNFALSGTGDDVVVSVGQYNILLTEAGDDTVLTAGKDNFVLTASGDDTVAAFGKFNLVASGSGSDVVIAFGQTNFVVTDNEITIDPQEIADYQKRVKDKKEADKTAADAADRKAKGLPEKTAQETPTSSTTNTANATGVSTKYEDKDIGASFTAGIAVSGSASVLFPDLEFSTEGVPDVYIPGFSTPQINLDIPDIPELRSRPDYQYGELGAYGLPEISLPDLTIPDLTVAGQALPSLSLPDVSDFGFRDDGLDFDFTLDIDFNPSAYAEISNVYKDLVGVESADGKAGIFNSSNGIRLSPNSGNAEFQAYTEQRGDVGPASGGNNTFFTGTDLANSPSITGSANGGYQALQTEDEFDVQVNPAEAAPETAPPTTISLPTFTLPEISVPSFAIGGADLSGLSDIDTILGGREFFGLSIPEFDIPAEYLEIPDFDLDDFASRDAVTLGAQTFTIPELALPTVAGVNWAQRFGSFNQTYNFLQTDADGGEGDIAVVGGRENRVYTGGGDDAALVLGKANSVYLGAGNDAAAVFGTERNFVNAGAGADILLAVGKTNSLNGGAGNDIVFAIGESNTVRGGTDPTPGVTDDNILIAIGKKNDIDSSNNGNDLNGGVDVAIAIGSENKVRTGGGDDTVLSVGVKNDTGTGGGNDIVVSIGKENKVDLGRGSDVALVLGVKTEINGDKQTDLNGDDIIFALGGRNKIEGNGGNDSIFVAGLYNTVLAGGDDDLVVSTGSRNLTSLGSGDDIGITIGVASLTTGGLGDDTIINVGARYASLGGAGNDVFLGIGNGYLDGGDDQDVFLNFGTGTLDFLFNAGISVVSETLANVVGALDTVLESFEVSGSAALGGVFSFVENSVLNGGADDDVFVAGFGNSVAFGGSGADQYIYTLGSGRFAVSDQIQTNLQDSASALTGTTAEGLSQLSNGDDAAFSTYFDDVENGVLGDASGSAASVLSNDAFVDVLIFRTANGDTTDITTDNLVFSDADDTIDVVVGGASLGQVQINQFGSEDIIRVVDHDSTSEITFGQLISSSTDAQDPFTEFDVVAAIQSGVDATIAYLSEGVADLAASNTSATRSIENGAFQEVSSIYDDLSILSSDNLVFV
ncbi:MULTISPECIES: hypothetical protein [unclassified Ruegeria]|uniref:beta strand repeat-containing protein n=1 Tax=unclassified Ruegeria TaxID=2625375 RepID=UPI001ADA7E9C|nr:MULTISPECIES: hypothetical protein [unclassified Ruegeria]MBO9412328.1 hypothetical protein [Ruegeria sp. R8_1]MBO9416434.1 hypothetical protein [Ruegeria sp. R8_2]